LARLEELTIGYVPKEENPPNVPQIGNLWTNLKRKINSNNYHPKDVNCLMTKVRKQLKSIETTGIGKVMKVVPAKDQKGHNIVSFFCK
jgi:hypothetical protein